MYITKQSGKKEMSNVSHDLNSCWNVTDIRDQTKVYNLIYLSRLFAYFTNQEKNSLIDAEGLVVSLYQRLPWEKYAILKNKKFKLWIYVKLGLLLKTINYLKKDYIHDE